MSTYKVIGNHVVGDTPPGKTFEADLEPDHPWIWGGHVELVKPKAEKPADPPASDDD